MKKSSILQIVIAICAVVGLFGGLPQIMQEISHTLHKPELGIYIENSTYDNSCYVLLFNLGDKNAEEVKVDIMVFDESGNLLATNETAIPLLPKPENDKILPINTLIKLDAKINEVHIDLDGFYYVKAFAKSKGDYTAEDYKEIRIY